MKEIKNLPASVRAKLFARSKANNEDFNRTLVRYGVERFLFRLSQHRDRNRFILKDLTGKELSSEYPARHFIVAAEDRVALKRYAANRAG